MKYKVMLVDESPGRAAILEQALIDEGYDVLARIPADSYLQEAVERMRPDVIIIDMESPNRDILEHMAMLSKTHPRPILMFADKSDSQTIGEAIRAGVSAYVVDGLGRTRLQPIMEVAIARFREFQALKNELEETRSRLVDRKDVEKAKGLLMQRRSLTEEEAYRALRKLAMDSNMKLGEVARNLLRAAELLA